MVEDETFSRTKPMGENISCFSDEVTTQMLGNTPAKRVADKDGNESAAYC